MKLLLDWSVLCYLNWHCMKSPNYDARTGIEKAEFSRNLASMVLYFMHRFKPEEVIFAMDAKGGYWRHKVMGDYYRKHAEIYMRLEEENKPQYRLKFDAKDYVITYIDGPNKWVFKKLTIAEKVEQDEKDWTPLEYDHNVPKEVINFLPRYKGNRVTSSWDFETPKATWQEWCGKISANLAATVGAKVLYIEKVEADDIAKVYADLYPGSDMVMVSTDSDWPQIMLDHLFLRIWQPSKRIWVERDVKEITRNMDIKILGGDRGDNIPGVQVQNKKGVSKLLAPPSKDAKKLNDLENLLLDQGDGIYDYMEENSFKPSLYRNYELIGLDNMPADIERAIKRGFRRINVQKRNTVHDWKDYGLSSKDIMATKGEATAHRNQDEGLSNE